MLDNGVTICSASSGDSIHISIPGRDAMIVDMVSNIILIWSPFAGDDVFLLAAAFLLARDLR